MATKQNSNDSTEKKTTAKTAASKTKAATSKAAASKTGTKSTASKTSAAKTSSAKTTTASKSKAATKSTAAKTTATKTASKTTATKTASAKTTASKTGAKTTAAKTTAKTSASKTAAATATRKRTVVKNETLAEETTAVSASTIKETKKKPTFEVPSSGGFDEVFTENAISEEEAKSIEKLTKAASSDATFVREDGVGSGSDETVASKPAPHFLSSVLKTGDYPHPGEKTMDKERKVQEELFNVNKRVPHRSNTVLLGVIAALCVVIAVLGVLFCVKSCSSKTEGSASVMDTSLEDAQRAKADLDARLSLVRTYMDAGFYDEALKELNELYYSNPDNEEVNSLLKSAMEGKRRKDEALANGGSDSNSAMDQFMQERLAALEEQNRISQEQLQQSAQAMQDMVRQNEARAAQEKQEAAEKAALQRAREEQAAKEKAEREAEEAKKAAQNAAFKAKNDKINKAIDAGIASLSSGDVSGAIANFDLAKKLLEEKDTNYAEGSLAAHDPAYAASKLSQISKELYEASQNTSLKDSDRKTLSQTAATYAGKAVQNQSDNAAAHYVLGMNAYETKDYATAEKELRSAASKDKDNYIYYYQLGRVQFAQKKYTDAATSFTTASSKNPSYAPAQYNLGVALERQGRNTEALNAYRKAGTIDATYENAFIAAGRILVRQGQFDVALNEFQKALNANPSNGVTYKEMGAVYNRLGRYSQAEQSFIKAISYMPSEEDPVTYYNLSVAQIGLKKTDAAYTNAMKAYGLKDVASASTKVEIVYNAGLTSGYVKKDDDAIRYYQEALKLDVNHVNSNINLAVLYLEIGNADQALVLLTRAYAKSPDNLEVNNDLGKAYLMKEEYSSAVKYFAKARQLDSSNIEVSENLARAYCSSGQFELAKPVYEDIVKADQKNWNAYLELSKVCIKIEDKESAEKWLLYLQSKAPEFEKAQVTSLLNSVK